jgi:hypothetical protein
MPPALLSMLVEATAEGGSVMGADGELVGTAGESQCHVLRNCERRRRCQDTVRDTAGQGAEIFARRCSRA